MADCLNLHKLNEHLSRLLSLTNLPDVMPKPSPRMAADDLVAIAKHAAAVKDFETVTDCWTILRGRSSERSVRRLEQTVAELSAAPVLWLDLARSVCAQFQRTARGDHHLYAILLRPVVEDQPFEIYIGESYYSPEARFNQHLCGCRSSRFVRKRGIALLPSLVAHLNPLQKEQAKELEPRLEQALKAVGIKTRGGH